MMNFRDTKGSPLTFAEMDANLRRLQGSANEVDLRDFNGFSATGLNDQTSVVQTALNQLVAAGGGVLHVPYSANTYKIAGPLVTSVADSASPNAQLYVPLVTLSDKMVVVEIRGRSATNISTEGIAPIPRNSQGIIFESTLLTDSGTIPALLGTAVATSGNTAGRNYVQVHLENLFLRTCTTNSSNGQAVPGQLSAINFARLIQFTAHNVKVDISSSLAGMTRPTNETHGIIMPDVNNKVKLDCGDLCVEGYTYGLTIGEHAVIQHLQCYGNEYGLVVPDGYHPCSVHNLTCEVNRNNILLNGTMRLNIGSYATEHYPAGNGQWYQQQSDVAWRAGASEVHIGTANTVISSVGTTDDFRCDPRADVRVMNGHGANVLPQDGGPGRVYVSDNDLTKCTYTGSWDTATASRYRGQLTHYTLTAGDYVEVSLPACRNVHVWSPRSQTTDTGFTVYADGQPIGTGIAQAPSDAEESRIVFHAYHLPYQARVIRVVFNGPGNFNGITYS